jgi:molybdopterin adenylyltransferase
VPEPSQFEPLSGFVLTVSDRCARGEREDLSGPAVVALLREHGFAVHAPQIVADERGAIEDALRNAAALYALVVTTGGTGLTARDVTPEATLAVCTRLLDGLAEQMRAAGLKETPFSVLSRGVCGTVGGSLIVNLPGSPRGAVTSLRTVLPVLPHALRLLVDPSAPHPATSDESPAR